MKSIFITLAFLVMYVPLTADVVLNKTEVITSYKLDPTSQWHHLFMAAKTGDLPSLHIALNNGADVDESNHTGTTALMIAAKYGNVHIAKALINKGASILKENKSNMRAIDFARIYENVEVYEYLLELEG